MNKSSEVMNYNKIRLLAEEQKLSIRKLCAKVGITDVGFRKMIEKDTMKIKTFEKITDVLGVSPCYFFKENGKPEDYKVKGGPRDYEKRESISPERENELLRELLLEKDKRLKLLEEKHKLY